MNARVLRACCVLLPLAAFVLAGCANVGSLIGPTTPNAVVDFSFTMAGPVDPNSYYFLALDTIDDNGATFPIPVAAGPYWGNGWGTGTITHFLEYHMGQYDLYRSQLNTSLTTRTGGFTGISGAAAGSSAGVYVLTVESVDGGGIATVRSVFTLHATGQTTTVVDTLPPNASTVSPLVPGLTLITGTLAVGDTATIAVELSPSAVLVTPDYFPTVPPGGGNTLSGSFDLAALGTNLTNLGFNFITTTQLIFDPSLTNPRDHCYDGLGPLGNDAIRRFDPRQFLSLTNAGSLIPEAAGDSTLQGPTTPAQRNSVDIVNWSLAVRRLQ